MQSVAELMQQLAVLRRRLRLALAADGVAKLVAAAGVVFLLAGATDWWLHLPWLLRAAGSVLAIGAAGAWLVRRVAFPLLRPIALTELAARIGQPGPASADRLVSLVHRWEHRAEGAAELWERVERETLAQLSAAPPTAALKLERPLRTAAAALVGVGLVAAMWGMQRDWVATAWQRFAWPPGPTTWPSWVRIAPLTGDMRVAQDEPFTAEMRITSGGSASLRAFLVTVERGGSPQRQMMRLDPDGVHRRIIDAVSRDTKYWFEAGDASTVDSAARLTAVPRPRVQQLSAEITPPRYLATATPAVQSLDEGRLSALEGSLVRLIVVSTKPVARAEAGAALGEVSRPPLPSIPLKRGSDDRTMIAEFTAEADGALEVRWVDADGLEPRQTRPIVLDVRPDEGPSVRIVSPAGSTEATADAELPIRVEALDDYGLSSLAVQFTRHDATKREDLWPTAARSKTGEGERATADFRLRPSALGAQPGDVIELRAVATDGYKVGDKEHAPAQSPPQRITIVAGNVLSERLRSEFAALQRQIQTLLNDQEATADRTDSLRQLPDGAERRRDQFGRVTNQQRGLVTRGRQIGKQFGELAERAAVNRLAESEGLAAGKRLGTAVAAVADGAMSQAVSALVQADQRHDSAEGVAALDAAATQQHEAIAELRALMGMIGEWTDLRDVVRRTRDLLDRQEALTRTTVGLSRETAGRALNELSDDQQAALRETGRGQERLRDETERTIRKLAEASASTSKLDPAAINALLRASGVAEGTGVVERMADATRAIAGNRLNQATDGQRQAENALRSILAALEQDGARQLEELSRQLQDLAKRLDRILAAQQRLIADTRAARKESDADERLRQQAGRQSSIEATTRTTARRVEAGDASGDVRRLLGDAAAEMAAAAGQLEKAGGDDAEASQSRAEQKLKDARARLDRAEQEAEQRASEQAMAALREELTKVRDAQQALADETQKLAARMAAAKRASRADRVQVRTLATRQDALVEPTEAVRQKLAGSIVVAYACERVIGGMKVASEALRASRAADAASTQATIVAELTRIIETLKPDPQDPTKQPRFADSGGAGGNSGAAGGNRPVPPLTELRLLRTLQAELNARTRAFAGHAKDESSPAEADLKLAEHLGVQQRELRELARRMFERAGEEQP